MLQIALENELEVIETSFVHAQLLKGIERENDLEAIRPGKATIEEIRNKNSITNGPIRVINWGRRLPA